MSATLRGHHLAEVPSTCRVCPRWAGGQQARLCPALSLSGRHPGCARCRGEEGRPDVLAPPQPLGASVPRDLTGSGRRRERQPCPVTTPRLVPVPKARALPGLQVACRAGEGRCGGVGVASQSSRPVSLAVPTRRLSARGIEGEDLRRGPLGVTKGFQATADGNASSPGAWAALAPPGHATPRPRPLDLSSSGAGSLPLSAPPAVSSDRELPGQPPLSRRRTQPSDTAVCTPVFSCGPDTIV